MRRGAEKPGYQIPDPEVSYKMPAALITTLFFALTAVCATQAARELGRNRANLLRLVIAVVLLGLWAHVAGQGHGGGALWRFFLAGAIAGVLFCFLNFNSTFQTAR